MRCSGWQRGSRIRLGVGLCDHWDLAVRFGVEACSALEARDVTGRAVFSAGEERICVLVGMLHLVNVEPCARAHECLYP